MRLSPDAHGVFSALAFSCILFSTLVNIKSVDGFGSEDGHAEGRVKCTNRFEYRHQIAEKVGSCEDIIRSNPICGKNLTVAYSLHPPYVFIDDGKISGILPSKSILHYTF